MKYRREVDGLRALAVLPVILYHAGFSGFSGGFVGVDIFFVISGYLITFIIAADLQNNSFSLADFYERRARRILPALFLVMFACLPLAWLCMFPSDMVFFAKGLVSVAAFSSNIYFWINTGNYFSPAADLEPLLHTWSLAVEEQYYVLFPLLLMFLWRFKRRLIVPALVIIAIASLAAAQWGSIHKPGATFFLLPTRMWELLIGALAAFYHANGYRQRNSELGGALGLLLILFSVFAFNAQTPFPSVFALAPTIGAVLILLFCSEQTIVGKLLGSHPVAGLGLISYSAYLWHQPLFAFVRNRSVYGTTQLMMASLCLLTLVLAYLTWRFVETPFRDRKLFTRRQIFVAGASISALFASVGLAGYHTGGFESLYQASLSPTQKVVYSYRDMPMYEIWREFKCDLGPAQTFRDYAPECQAPDGNKPTLLIWGDSHAAAISKALRELHGNVIQYTASACPPLVNTTILPRPNCREINDFVVREVKRLKPTEIFLEANWYGYDAAELDPAQRVRKTIEIIREVSPNSRVTIIGGVPQFPPSLPKLMLRTGTSLDQISYLASPLYSAVLETNEKLRQTASVEKVEFLSPLTALCSEKACQASVAFNGKIMPIIFDNAHLTEGGALLAVKRMMAANKTMPADQSTSLIVRQ